MSPSYAAEDMGPAPDSLEAPPPAPAGPAKPGGTTKTTHEQVNYTSAAERCETCEHFDDAAMHCKKNDFDCEPQGHCNDFTVMGEGVDQPPEDAGAELMDDEMEDLEDDEY